MVTTQPVPVSVVERVPRQEPQRRQDVVDVLDDPLVGGGGEPQAEAAPQAEPREIGPMLENSASLGSEFLIGKFPKFSVAALSGPRVEQCDLPGSKARRRAGARQGGRRRRRRPTREVMANPLPHPR